MNRFTLSFIIPLCLVAKLGAAAEVPKPTQTSILKGQNGRHSFVLRLAKGPFRASRHKITGVAPTEQNNYTDNRRIDGQKWHGTDGGLPRKEFYAFDVTVDGKRWQIPAYLYSNCYQPNIHIKKHPFVWAWITKDGKRLTVKMHASDGAGAYGVIWHFRKNGKHSRNFWSRV